MKSKLFSPARKEAGFTLIELLTVIVIIGILAAIAIPLFAAQKARAQDAQTVSDVRNIAIAAESFLVDKTNTFDDVNKASMEFASSANVSWDIKGSSSIGGYCIVAKNTAGKKYTTDATALTYDSLAGGLGRTGTACSGSNIPVPSGSTAVGSLVAGPVLDTTAKNFVTNGSGSTGSIQNFAVPAAGTYKIEAYGASGGSTYSGGAGGAGAYASGIVKLNSGQNLSILVGQSGGNGIYASGDPSHFQNGSGGGGTFVAVGTDASATALVVAGGGGGGQADSGASYMGANNGSTTNSGTGSPAPSNNGVSSGAGFISDSVASSYASAAKSFANGGTGSVAISTYPVNPGGFGGGGAAGHIGAGGGGGYTGGIGGYYSPAVIAGGGGSYVVSNYNGTATSSVVTDNTTKANIGQGKVVITRIS
jgi:prepilin-type N-terminal cleavage/methylation domain-containing protein